MSAVVYCGKRSSSIFADELLPPSPSSHHHGPAAKRSRFSPPPQHRREALVQQLRAFFPDMDPQLLERALEASGDDLDSAIKSLKELHLEPTQAVLSATASENGQPTAVQPSVEGTQQ
ncbi:hypothetical protein ACQ4PT_001041 [Festuca glaucescens]